MRSPCFENQEHPGSRQSSCGPHPSRFNLGREFHAPARRRPPAAQAARRLGPLRDGRAIQPRDPGPRPERVAESVAFPSVKAQDVVHVFAAAAATHGLPAAFLSDNAAVFAGQYRGGTVLLESELARLGIRAVHSRAYHPQTCGKVERFHQTLKRFLAKQAPPISIAHLQTQLDVFRSYYNQRRPHRALSGRTPLVAWSARLKAAPAPIAAPTLFRVRLDKVDRSGRVTLRHLSVLRHIHVGRRYTGERIRLLIAGTDVRIVRESGELLGEVTLDASRNYQTLRRPAIVHDHLRQVSSIT